MPNERQETLEEKIMKGISKKSLDGLGKLKPDIMKPQREGDNAQSQQNEGNTPKTRSSSKSHK